MHRIGILMPRSTLFPSLGLNLLNGLKENLKEQHVYEQVKLVIDNIGFGINEPEIYAKAEKMLLEEEVEMVIVCADTIITEMLQPLFTASNKILLVVNFGANFPENWQPAATTIVHSLNFCMHAGLTGKLAAEETNKQSVNVVSFYDGGYRQCFCMLNSHQQNGGVPRFNHVSTLKAGESNLSPITGFLEQNNDVNTLLCLFAGGQAELFYREISPVQKEFGLNLYVSSMMLDGSLKEVLGNEFSIDKVKGFVPWHDSLKNEANNIFKERIASSNGHTVNYFYLLGWETGLILSEIVKQNEAGNTKATTVIKSLTETSFDSPRGRMKIDAATHYSYGPSYLAVCKNNMEISIEYEVEDIDAVWAAFTNEKLPPGENSSWRNTYLCI